jgi:hypothetical protein
MNENSNDDSDNDQQTVSVEEKYLSIDRMLSLTEELIHGTKQRSFISEQQVMSLYKIKEQLLRKRPKHMKQFTLQEVF